MQRTLETQERARGTKKASCANKHEDADWGEVRRHVRSGKQDWELEDSMTE